MNSWDLLIRYVLNNLSCWSDAQLDQAIAKMEVELRERHSREVVPWPGNTYFGDDNE